MKINSHEIENFINKLQSENSIKIIILYGQDTGLIEERKRILTKKFFLNQLNPDITEFQADDLKKNPSLLQNTAYTYSMLQENNKKIILITEAKDFLTSIIESYLTKIDKDTLIIITANELSKNSSLRILGEKSNYILILPCYFDDLPTLQKLISNNLKNHGFDFDKSVIDYLSVNLGNNRAITLQELKKLKTYTYLSKKITLSDAKSIIQDNSNQNFDELINNIFLRKKNLIYQNFKHFDNLITLNFIRYLINHLYRLLLIKISIKNKEDLNTSLKKLKPPIFFNQIENFKKQLNMYTLKDLKMILQNLISTELKLREFPYLAETILLNCCQNIINQN